MDSNFSEFSSIEDSCNNLLLFPVDFNKSDNEKRQESLFGNEPQQIFPPPDLFSILNAQDSNYNHINKNSLFNADDFSQTFKEKQNCKFTIEQHKYFGPNNKDVKEISLLRKDGFDWDLSHERNNKQGGSETKIYEEYLKLPMIDTKSEVRTQDYGIKSTLEYQSFKIQTSHPLNNMNTNSFSSNYNFGNNDKVNNKKIIRKDRLLEKFSINVKKEKTPKQANLDSLNEETAANRRNKVGCKRKNKIKRVQKNDNCTKKRSTKKPKTDFKEELSASSSSEALNATRTQRKGGTNPRTHIQRKKRQEMSDLFQELQEISYDEKYYVNEQKKVSNTKKIFFSKESILKAASKKITDCEKLVDELKESIKKKNKIVKTRKSTPSSMKAEQNFSEIKVIDDNGLLQTMTHEDFYEGTLCGRIVISYDGKIHCFNSKFATLCNIKHEDLMQVVLNGESLLTMCDPFTRKGIVTCMNSLLSETYEVGVMKAQVNGTQFTMRIWITYNSMENQNDLSFLKFQCIFS